MTEEKFWQIIDSTRSKSGGDSEKHQELITEALINLSPGEIIEFDKQFHALERRAYRWNLWAAAYIINGGCSEECFEDFRGWLIAQGKKVFEKAIEDPGSLAYVDGLDEDTVWEGFAYCASDAYNDVTGHILPVEEGLNHQAQPSGEPWDEDEVEELFPELAVRFG